MVVVEKVIIVSVHVRYFSFFSFFQFKSDRLRQVTKVTSGYISLRRRDGTWSSTTGFRGRVMNNRLGTIQGRDKDKTGM